MTAPTTIDGSEMTDEQIRKSMTSEQIQLERRLTCEAIDGAIAFGYQNTNAPPSDNHWLVPFWKIGRKQAELELLSASKPAAPMGCVLVEEADFVPHVHPQYGSGVFCTEDCLNKLAASPAAPSADTQDERDEDDYQPTPESERAAFNAMLRWHLIRILQAWRYGGDLRASGMAAFEWARSNDVGKEAFKASEKTVKLAALTSSTVDPAAPVQSGEPIGYVNAEWYKYRRGTTTLYPESHPRIATSPLYAAPQPSQPAEGGEACSPFKCEAAYQDGVLCADESCDIAMGVRAPSAVVLDDERAAFEARIAELENDRNSWRALAESAKRELATRAASPQATETQLVGWFMQRSKFGPWIETESHEPGAVQFYRTSQPASGGDHDHSN